MSDKRHDGASQIGGAFVRPLEQLGLSSSTKFGMEVRPEDGSLGTFETRKLIARTAVHRQAPLSAGKPFLCSWAGDEITFVGKEFPASRRRFALTEEAKVTPSTPLLFQVSNSAFVGDGWLASVMATTDVRPDTYFVPVSDEQYLAPVLTRLPNCYPAHTKEAFFAATPEEQSKMSLRLDPIRMPAPLDGLPLRMFGRTINTQIGVIYVIPMGWKNEEDGYMFAVVMSTPSTDDVGGFAELTLAPRPRVWICSTRTGETRAVPPQFGVSWPWRRLTNRATAGSGYLPRCSHVACTAPGRLEFTVYEPESNDFVRTQFQEGTAPAIYFWENSSTIPSSGVVGLEGAWGPSFAMNSQGNYRGRGANTSLSVFFNTIEYVPRRPSMFLVRSDDFGATWTKTHQPAFEASTIEHSPNNAAFAGFGGLATPVFVPNQGLTSYPSPTTVMGLNTYVVIDAFPTPPPGNLSYVPRAVRPAQAQVGPRSAVVSNRGASVRPEVEIMTLIGAGSSTFALIATCGPTELVTNVRTSQIDAWDSLYLDSFFWNTLGTPITITMSFEFNSGALQLYRRTGESFARMPWPGDDPAGLFESVGLALPLTRFGTRFFRSSAVIPWDGPSEFAQGFGSGEFAQGFRRNSGRFGATWLSTGEGRIAFILVESKAVSQGDAFLLDTNVIVVATADNGNNWTSRAITGSNNLRDFCVVREKLETFLLYAGAPRPPEPGAPPRAAEIRQLWRFTLDFTDVLPYGNPFTPSGPGLVNFQGIIHPGFPGAYDEPAGDP